MGSTRSGTETRITGSGKKEEGKMKSMNKISLGKCGCMMVMGENEEKRGKGEEGMEMVGYGERAGSTHHLGLVVLCRSRLE